MKLTKQELKKYKELSSFEELKVGDMVYWKRNEDDEYDFISVVKDVKDIDFYFIAIPKNEEERINRTLSECVDCIFSSRIKKHCMDLYLIENEEDKLLFAKFIIGSKI